MRVNHIKQLDFSEVCLSMSTQKPKYVHKVIASQGTLVINAITNDIQLYSLKGFSIEAE